jgi:Uma2 family endonuclease
LGPKAKLYAAFAVREYWVVDAKTLVTRVHREPDAAGYRTITEVAPEAPLTPIALAGIVLRLAELDLG